MVGIVKLSACNRLSNKSKRSSICPQPQSKLSMSRLFREERTVTDPKFCEGFEILLVTASNCVFLPTFHADATLSCRVRLDLYHKRGIHERGSMDPNESVRLQLFGHHRD